MIVRLSQELDSVGTIVTYYQADPMKRLPWLWDKRIESVEFIVWRQDPGKLTSIDLAWNLPNDRTIDLYTELHSLEHIADAAMIIGFPDREPNYIKLPSMGMSKLYRSILNACQ